MHHRTPKGAHTSHWQVKAGQAKKNEAWDCRIYATGAAVVHCQSLGTVPLQVGLLRFALQEGGQTKGRWTDDEMESFRRHLQVAGVEEHATASNVSPLR